MCQKPLPIIGAGITRFSQVIFELVFYGLTLPLISKIIARSSQLKEQQYPLP